MPLGTSPTGLTPTTLKPALPLLVIRSARKVAQLQARRNRFAPSRPEGQVQFISELRAVRTTTTLGATTASACASQFRVLSPRSTPIRSEERRVGRERRGRWATEG